MFVIATSNRYECARSTQLIQLYSQHQPICLSSQHQAGMFVPAAPNRYNLCSQHQKTDIVVIAAPTDNVCAHRTKFIYLCSSTQTNMLVCVHSIKPSPSASTKQISSFH